MKRFLVGLALGISSTAAPMNEDKIDSETIEGVVDYILKTSLPDILSLYSTNKICEDKESAWAGMSESLTVSRSILTWLVLEKNEEIEDEEFFDINAFIAARRIQYILDDQYKSKDKETKQIAQGHLDMIKRSLSRDITELYSAGSSMFNATIDACTIRTHRLFDSIVARLTRDQENCEPCLKLLR